MPALAAIIAVILTVVQVAFFSHLSALLSSISLLTVALCLAVGSGRNLEAAIMALVGGCLLDLHGIFGFGTELSAAFISFIIMRALFGRFFSNVSLVAVFLLAVCGVATRFLVLAAVDGLRVLTGQDPYLLITDPALVTGPLLAMLTTGVVTLIAAALARTVGRLARRLFLPSKLSLKP